VAVARSMVGGGRSGACSGRAGPGDPSARRRQLSPAALLSLRVGAGQGAGSPGHRPRPSSGGDRTVIGRAEGSACRARFRRPGQRPSRQAHQRRGQRTSRSVHTGRRRVASTGSFVCGRDPAAGGSSELVHPRRSPRGAAAAAATEARATGPESPFAAPRPLTLAGGRGSSCRPAIAASRGLRFRSSQLPQPRFARCWQSIQPRADGELAEPQPSGDSLQASGRPGTEDRRSCRVDERVWASAWSRPREPLP
jgi:hypothetical protein